MPVFPIYVLADRSGSMAAPADPARTPAQPPPPGADPWADTAIAVVNRVIAQLLDELSRDPMISAAARVAVLSFAEDATVDLPLTRLTSRLRPPVLRAGGRTSLAAAFETLARTLTHDLAALPEARAPMLFLLTDGRANAPRDLTHGWRAERRRVLDSAGDRRPLLVPFGFGQADPAALAELASDPTAAYLARHTDAPSAAIAQFAELVFASVASSVAHGEPRTVPPPGSRILTGDEEEL